MRALPHDPSLLILDEPTVGVDLEARHQIWAHIRSLRAAGRTVVLTTNYLDEAEALCDRVAILRNGKLLAEDTPGSLTARTGRCLELDAFAGILLEFESWVDCVRANRFEDTPDGCENGSGGMATRL